MNFLSEFSNEELVLVVPNELKKYFFELRKEVPTLNFKLFSLGNLFDELRGRYLSKEALLAAYRFFPEYTYNAIKEVLEIVYRSFCIEKSKNKKLIELSNYLKDKGLLFENDDLKLLLQNRKVLFVNFEHSTLVKSLIQYLDINNYKFLRTIDVIDSSSTSNCYRFFNIIDETHYGVNEILYNVYKKRSSDNIKVILDTNRFEFYLTCLLGKIDVPYRINGTRSLVDTKTYKFLYNNVTNDSVIVLNLLEENKDNIDDEFFDDIYKILNDISIDSLINKKTNIYELLLSRPLNSENAKNAIDFVSGVCFSRKDELYVMGLDNSFMPKAKKNNKLFSYEFRYSLGLDSLDDVNFMKSDLEQAFLKQKNIKYISYHVKDNSGRYASSYYLDALKIKTIEAPAQKFEFNDGVAKFIYSNYVDKFNKSGESNLSLSIYNNYFKNEELKLYSNAFSGIKNYKFDNSRSFSYSSLNRYHNCPFQYYLNDVIKLGEFTSNTHAKFGTLAHNILINVYEPSFVYKDEFIKVYNKLNEEDPFTKTENMLLVKYYKEIEKSVEKLIEHKSNMLFKRNHSEMSFGFNEFVEFDDFVDNEFIAKKYEIKLYGRLDSVIETTSETLFVVDYKTGQDAFTKKGFLEKNTCTQLPFYYYLVKNSKNKETYSKQIDGCFIKPLLIDKGKFYNIYNPDEEDLNSIKFSGFYYADFDAISKFDTTLISLDPTKDKLESPYISKLKLNKKKEKGKDTLPISKRSSGALSIEDFVEIEQTIKKYIANSIYGIATSKFEIAPFIDGNKKPCIFCDFKDCCLNSLLAEDEESEEDNDE